MQPLETAGSMVKAGHHPAGGRLNLGQLWEMSRAKPLDLGWYAGYSQGGVHEVFSYV